MKSRGALLALIAAATATAAAAAASSHEGLRLLRRAVEDFEPLQFSPCEGRGIVISAGGPVLLANTLSLLAMLRGELGSQLPVEVYHAGAGELPARDGIYLESFPAVTVIDVLELPELAHFPRQLSQGAGKARGYQTKVYAALQSSFCEVLVLDADNTPMQDPAVLFDEPLYRERGSLFWPDYNCTAAWVSSDLTDALGLPSPSLAETSTESGAFLLDKARHQDALEYTWLLNAYHDIIYGKYAHGDKDLYRLGFQLAGKGAEFAQATVRPAAVYARAHLTGAGAMEGFGHFAMVQHSPSSGQMMLLHRTTLHSKLVAQAVQSTSDLVVTAPLSLEYVFHRLQFEHYADFVDAPEVLAGRRHVVEVLGSVQGLLRREEQTVLPAIRAGRFLSSFARDIDEDASDVTLASLAAAFYSHESGDSGHYREYFSHHMRRLHGNGTNMTVNGTEWNETEWNETEWNETGWSNETGWNSTNSTNNTKPTKPKFDPTLAYTVVSGELRLWVDANVESFVDDPYAKSAMEHAIAAQANVPWAYVYIDSLTEEEDLPLNGTNGTMTTTMPTTTTTYTTYAHDPEDLPFGGTNGTTTTRPPIKTTTTSKTTTKLPWWTTTTSKKWTWTDTTKPSWQDANGTSTTTPPSTTTYTQSAQDDNVTYSTSTTLTQSHTTYTHTTTLDKKRRLQMFVDTTVPKDAATTTTSKYIATTTIPKDVATTTMSHLDDKHHYNAPKSVSVGGVVVVRYSIYIPHETAEPELVDGTLVQDAIADATLSEFNKHIAKAMSVDGLDLIYLQVWLLEVGFPELSWFNTSTTTTTTVTNTTTTTTATTTSTYTTTTTTTVTTTTITVTTTPAATFAVLTGQVSCNIGRNAQLFTTDPQVMTLLKQAVAAKVKIAVQYITLHIFNPGRRLQTSATSAGPVVVLYTIRIPLNELTQGAEGERVRLALEGLTTTELNNAINEEIAASPNRAQLEGMYGAVSVSAITAPTLYFEAAGATSTSTVTTTTTLYSPDTMPGGGTVTHTQVSGEIRCRVPATNAETFIEDESVRQSFRDAIVVQGRFPLSYLTSVTMSLERNGGGPTQRRLQGQGQGSSPELTVVVSYVITVPASADELLRDGTEIQHAIATSTTSEFAHSIRVAMSKNQVSSALMSFAVSAISVPQLIYVDPASTTTWRAPQVTRTTTTTEAMVHEHHDDSHACGLPGFTATHLIAALLLLWAPCAA